MSTRTLAAVVAASAGEANPIAGSGLNDGIPLGFTDKVRDARAYNPNNFEIKLLFPPTSKPVWNDSLSSV